MLEWPLAHLKLSGSSTSPIAKSLTPKHDIQSPLWSGFSVFPDSSLACPNHPPHFTTPPLCWTCQSSPNSPRWCWGPSWSRFSLELYPWILPLLLLSSPSHPEWHAVHQYTLTLFDSGPLHMLLLDYFLFLCLPISLAFALPSWFLLILTLPWSPGGELGAARMFCFGTLCSVFLITAVPLVIFSKLNSLCH